jgi:hypothetical protein
MAEPTAPHPTASTLAYQQATTGPSAWEDQPSSMPHLDSYEQTGPLIAPLFVSTDTGAAAAVSLPPSLRYLLSPGPEGTGDQEQGLPEDFDLPPILKPETSEPLPPMDTGLQQVPGLEDFASAGVMPAFTTMRQLPEAHAHQTAIWTHALGEQHMH